MKKQAAYHMLFEKMLGKDEYFAYFISEYQELEKLSDEEVKGFLECTNESFYRLAFCRVPSRNDNFTTKLSRIANYVNISKAKLVTLINRVHAIHALRQSSQAAKDQSLLLAAREKKDKANDDKTSSKK